MRKRSVRVLTLAATMGLMVPALTLPISVNTRVLALDTTTWCTTPFSAPCIVSVSRDGVDVPDNSPDWDVSVYGSKNSDGEYLAQWDIEALPASGSYVDMGTAETAHTWSVTINMGTHDPRVTDSYADDATIVRSTDVNSRNLVTITGTPVTMGVNDECDTSVAPASCPAQAGQDVTYFGGDIGDFGQWSDAAQLNDFDGMDSWTNIEETSVPPLISGDPATVVEQLSNSHKLADGSVAHGDYHIVLPDAFLEDMGVDDPTTIGTDGIAATIGSGTATITPGATSVQVDVTGITFSPRTLKLARGTVTPTRPSGVTAKRVSTFRAKVTFTRSKVRGSAIRGYQGRCQAAHHPSKLVTGSKSPLTIVKLHPRTAYTCQVRATSRAGKGKWSATAKLSAKSTPKR
jgi:Fibronectin type III domain